jgi:hypothetical protein
MKLRFFIITLLMGFSFGISAQDGYTVKQDYIKSDILKQNRKLSIFLPDGYDAQDARFPQIYYRWHGTYNVFTTLHR